MVSTAVDSGQSSKRSAMASATMSTNPFVDYHVVYALILLVVAWVPVRAAWGLGRRWAQLPIVDEHPILR